MADFNAMYAVVDKSKKKHLPLPQDGTADTNPPLYNVARGDVSTKPAPTEKAEVIDSEYSMITAESVNPKAKKPAPEEYNTLQYPMQEAPANRTEVFDSTYSMVALDNVHSTVNDGDLQSQQPAETDMSTGKNVTKAAAADKQGTVGGKNKTAIMCFSIFIAIAFIIALVASVAFLFIKVGNLEAETAALRPGQLAALDSSIMGQLQQINDSIARFNNNSINHCLINMSLDDEVAQIQASLQMLYERLNLNTDQFNSSIETIGEQVNLNTDQLKSSIETISGDIIAIEDKTQLLIDYFQIGQSEENPSPSCAALRGLSPSGYYWVRTSNGSAVRVYCDMTRSCGGVTGGWVRVAYLDKTNSNRMCPSGLMEYISFTVHTCRRNDTSAGCSSVQFTTHELSYSKVCGRITALADGAPEGFMRTDDTDINGTYVDGVSLTHGAPRQHIWTFAATSSEETRRLSCSCNNSNTAGTPPPEYVGNDYFCDTRFRETDVDRDLVLWQGTDCTSSNACCSFNNPPWFYKQLPQPTTDDIEMRVCRDEDRGNEDVFIQIVEVYIQ